MQSMSPTQCLCYNASGSSVNLPFAYLQSAFDTFQISLITHQLVLNTDKMTYMLFSRSRNSVQPAAIFEPFKALK